MATSSVATGNLRTGLTELDWWTQPAGTSLEEDPALSTRGELQWTPTRISPPSEKVIVIDVDPVGFKIQARVPWSVDPAWFMPTVLSLAHLLILPGNWDSYGARPVDPRAIENALRLLVAMMTANTRPPNVVPTSRGTVQLEWHTRGLDVEIEVRPTGVAYFSCEDPQSGSQFEGQIPEHLTQLEAAIARLST